MSVQEAIQQLRYAPLADRLQVIELLIQSLKDEITRSESVQVARKPFRVRTFNLGTDIHIDRDEMYADRVIL